MTRLSEALRKAAAETATQPDTTVDPAAPASWQFAAVETMHVPDEPALSLDADVAEPPPPVAAAPPSSGRTPFDAGAIKPIVVGDADRGKLVVADGVDASVIEQYRHLAATLHHAQQSSGVRSVMVTSAVASEGKTLTATNLALTLSQSYQRRVLLIDADLRRPRMREMFALAGAHGLTDALTDAHTDRLPVQQVTPTLWVLTSGRTVPDPMSLLVSPAMKQLLDAARDAFDWVVVDTPPVAILSDANLLSAMIDTAVLVVSAQSTPYPMVQRAVAAIGANRVLGVVLNRAEKSSDANYNYGYAGYQPYGRAARSQRRWFGWLRRPSSNASSGSAAGPGHVQ